MFNNINYNTNNILFYDNSKGECNAHKNNDKNHIGNPWHCFGHLELWYHISSKLNINLKTNPNLTLIMTRYDNNKFGPNIPIYHFYKPYFKHIINKDIVINKLSKKYSNKQLFYIKEFIIDERSMLGFGAATIWRLGIPKKFKNDDDCKNKQLRRSKITNEMKELMINYYDRNDIYSKHDWIKELNDKKFNIYGNDLNYNTIKNNKNISIIVIASRWINGICRYRCLKNINKLKDKFVKLFINNLGKNNTIIIYGNPGILSFSGQYNSFRNCDIFIGVHGAVFLMSSLFMNAEKLKFEIVFKGNNGNENDGPNSELIVNMFGDGIHKSYAKYFCKKCLSFRNSKPPIININNVIKQFSKSIYESYNIVLDFDKCNNYLSHFYIYLLFQAILLFICW